MEIDPNRRFDKVLAGDGLATIRKAMPHHDEMQSLVRMRLEEFCRNLEQEKIEVMDIGTGVGYTASQLLSADSRIRLTSFDNEPKMIAGAQENMKSEIESGRLRLEQKDALEFLKQMPDGSFEAIASAYVIHNFEKNYREQAIKEIYRILKPGGVFINSDKLYPDDEGEYQKEYQWQLDMFMKADVDEKTRKGWLEHYEFDNRPDIAVREGEMLKMLEEAGFKEMEISNRNHLEALLVAKK